jgi:hypothetical protein
MQWSRRFLGIIGWDPNVCKSNWLHVDIPWFFFIELGYILWIPLKQAVIFVQSWTSTGHFSNSTGSFVTNCQFSPIIDIMNCVINASHQISQPTPSHCAMCQYVECHLLILVLVLFPHVKCWCMHMPHRPGRPSGADLTTSLKCCTLCYSIVSHATLIL